MRNHSKIIICQQHEDIDVNDIPCVDMGNTEVVSHDDETKRNLIYSYGFNPFMALIVTGTYQSEEYDEQSSFVALRHYEGFDGKEFARLSDNALIDNGSIIFKDLLYEIEDQLDPVDKITLLTFTIMRAKQNYIPKDEARMLDLEWDSLLALQKNADKLTMAANSVANSCLVIIELAKNFTTHQKQVMVHPDDSIHAFLRLNENKEVVISHAKASETKEKDNIFNFSTAKNIVLGDYKENIENKRQRLG